MEPVVATGGTQWQIRSARNPPKQAESVAVGCERLPEKFHGKEAQTGTRGMIAVARFLPTMLARFPRRSQGVLTNYSPTSRAAVRSPAYSAGT